MGASAVYCAGASADPSTSLRAGCVRRSTSL